MHFCPLCESLLLLQTTNNENYLNCRACPYRLPIKKKITRTVDFVPPTRFDQIFNEEESKLSKIQINCSKCDSNEAFFFQMQTRSADEGSTIFYKCVKCGHNWKEN